MTERTTVSSCNLQLTFRLSRAARQAAQELGLSYQVVAKPNEVIPGSNPRQTLRENRVVGRLSGFDEAKYFSFWSRTQQLVNRDLEIQSSY